MRVLVDASALIALAKCGELEVLRDLLGEIHVTSIVLEEAIVGPTPERETILAAQHTGWLHVATFSGDPATLQRYGVDAGEASLILAASPEDLLLLDDRNARRLAESRGLRRVGLLGLLVAGVEGGDVTPERGLRVLDRLARGSFRMTIELYQWAFRSMSDANKP